MAHRRLNFTLQVPIKAQPLGQPGRPCCTAGLYIEVIWQCVCIPARSMLSSVGVLCFPHALPSYLPRGRRVSVLYLDVWQPDEMEKVRVKFYNDPTLEGHVSKEEAAERYEIFGGIIRYVLVQRNLTKEKLLNELQVGVVDMSDMLVHIRVSSGRRIIVRPCRCQCLAPWLFEARQSFHMSNVCHRFNTLPKTAALVSHLLLLRFISAW